MLDLSTLPKAHLHVHLDGAMRRPTLIELAGKGGIEVPVVQRYGSFSAFADSFSAAQLSLASLDDLGRLVREVVEDAAADGAVWLEVSVWPGFLCGRLGSQAEVTQFILDAGQEAANHIGIGFGLMLAANRNLGPDESVGTARLASSLAGRGVVGFGLDGDEAAHPPELFTEAFTIASDAGLLSTPHAGELLGPESVVSALHGLRADRILHGIRAIEDPVVVRLLLESGVCLDVCPTSNLMLGVVPALADHPLPALLAAGVVCSVNADDPLLFGNSLLGEYELCRNVFGLGDAQLAAIARASLLASAAPRDVIAKALAGIDAWLDGSGD